MSFRTRSTKRRCSRSTIGPSAVSRNLVCSAARSACTPAFRRASVAPPSASVAGGDSMESALWRRGRSGGKGQDLEARTGDQYRVLPLRGEAMVLGDDGPAVGKFADRRSEEHTSELQSPCNLVCRLLLEKKKKNINKTKPNSNNNHRSI